MKAWLVALLAAAAAAAALPAAAGGSLPGEAVVGAGSVTFSDFPGPGERTTERFTIVAFGRSSDAARGTIRFETPLGPSSAQLRVTCLVVAGNTAYVAARFAEPYPYLGGPLTHLALVIEDNGPFADRMTGFGFRPRPPGFDHCAAIRGAVPDLPVERGDFVVIDGR